MKSLSTLLGLAPLVHAGLRFPCSTLTVQRLDPVVEPGALPAAHVHHIVGGNAFNATMEGDVGERFTCTTCQMADDGSNYWTAHLYFKDPDNGSYHRVPVIPVQPLLGGSQGAKGGLTVYYTQFDLSKDNLAQQKITAFKPVSSVVSVFVGGGQLRSSVDTFSQLPLNPLEHFPLKDPPGFPHDCRFSK